MNRCASIVSPAVVAIALAGCGGGGASEADAGAAVSLAEVDVARVPASSVPSQALSAAVAANDAFAVDLYAHLDADAGAANLLTSPLSASLALTMAYAGARGPTATQMASALHFAGSESTIFEGQNALDQALASRGAAALAVAQQDVEDDPGQPAPSASDYALQIVDSVWGEKTYPWATPFLTTLAQSYGAGVYLEDFIGEPDPSRQAIDAWVSGATDGKIDDLLPPGSIDSTTRMVLVNAIHLKLPWDTAFDATLTAPAAFTRPDGSTVSPSFMHETVSLPYADDGQAQIVALPLSNRQLAVIVAVPHDGVDLATYEAELTPTSAALAQPASAALVALSLPKVTFTSPTFSLAAALKAMGMVEAFDPSSADFTGMCPTTPDGARLYVEDVLQKAMIAVQETGVEAAAATAVVVAGLNAVASPPQAPVQVDVDRPFVIAVVDVPTGAVLFLGHVVDPTAAGGP